MKILCISISVRNLFLNTHHDVGSTSRNQSISDQTVLCSRHFKLTDFKWTPVRKTLKPDSVPSIFDWSNQVTPRRELFKHPVPQKRPRPEYEDEAGDNAADLGCEPIPEIQDGDLSLCYYYKSVDNVNVTIGRQRNMLLIDELFMFLCRLKCGLLTQDLAVRFNCHISTVSRSFNIWPNKYNIEAKMPAVFRMLYPSTRVVIDCTEIKTERPSSLALGSKCYSSYKSSHTWKGLVGIAPHGALTFVSSLYTGSMSDVEITKLCGLIDLLESGDSIMADKGFVLNKVLDGTGITVNTPPFLMSHGQFSRQEVEETQTIAKLRIHIERHIRRVKEYHLFDNIIPLSMVGTINQLWTVANMLTLFKGPLVKDWHQAV
ncbi:unnamed protein product [Mytilus edulis]|uniref:THAP-type domain-containing protein n=1 Tax=Mytilus edulis TaxID=6550 RepID=A0A8S3QG37_MYTED|nr:unnamed protein product [Mytilus edulis]